MRVTTYVFWVLLLVVAVTAYDMIYHTLENKTNSNPAREIERVDCMFKDYAVGCVTTYKKEEE